MTGDEAIAKLLGQLDEPNTSSLGFSDHETMHDDLINIEHTYDTLESVEPSIDIGQLVAIANQCNDESDSDSGTSYVDDKTKDPDFNASSFIEEEDSDNMDDRPSTSREACGQEDVNIVDTQITDTNSQRLQEQPLHRPSQVPSSFEEPKPKSRKRKRQPHKWIRNVKKSQHVHGQEYINTKGNLTKAKKIGADCKCRRQCFDKVGRDNILTQFNNFYALETTEVQDCYWFRSIKSSTPNRRRPRTIARKTPLKTERSASFKYYVKSQEGQDVEVCQKVFKSIYGLGTTRSERIWKRQLEVPRDRRGKHGNQKKIDDTIKQRVNSHIISFPRRMAHYSRRKINPNKVYLHEGFNVNRMWLCYLEQYEKEEYEKYKSGNHKDFKPIVKYAYYKPIFDTEHNIGFGNPRSNTCLKCDQLNLQIETLKRSGDDQSRKTKEDELRLHQSQAENGYALLTKLTKAARERNDLAVFTFDFQQNLPIPKLTTSDMFYSRMLWLYNFGIHDCRTGEGIMNVWCETEAGRGSSEVCSCLNKVLVENRRNAKRLVLFSDGCVGQNKNRAMVIFLQTLIEAKVYERIDHYFLYRGHTYLPNDRDFAMIEKRKVSTPKIEMSSEYVSLIRDSKHVKPFTVNEVKNQDILDFKAIAEKSMTKTTMKTTGGATLQFTNVHWFSYGASEQPNETYTGISTIQHDGQVWCRYSHKTKWNIGRK